MGDQKKGRGKILLLFIVLLPFVVYLLFIKSSGENFFERLSVVGPRSLETRVDEQGKSYQDTAYYTIPDFEFTNQDGRIISQRDYAGKIYLVNFFFTTCPSICPAMNYNMLQLQKRFEGFEDFAILSHTVDPEKDDVAALKAYAEELGANTQKWNFVTGTKEKLYHIATKYLLNAAEDSLAEGGFLHSESFVLIDYEGRIRSGRDEHGNPVAVYDGTSPAEIKKLEEDIKVLIAEYEKEKAKRAYQQEKEKKSHGN